MRSAVVDDWPALVIRRDHAEVAQLEALHAGSVGKPREASAAFGPSRAYPHHLVRGQLLATRLVTALVTVLVDVAGGTLALQKAEDQSHAAAPRAVSGTGSRRRPGI
jgi:hypothetical protein